MNNATIKNQMIWSAKSAIRKAENDTQLAGYYLAKTEGIARDKAIKICEAVQLLESFADYQ